MPDHRDLVSVRLDARELGPATEIGRLLRERSRGRSVFSFAYDPAWLASRSSFQIDPKLLLFEGDQPADVLPGIFQDMSPDRWGTLLIERREALAARLEHRRSRELEDWDVLVEVNDHTRMGALRIADASSGLALSSEPLAVPPHTELRALKGFAGELEGGLPVNVDNATKWLQMLIAPGSSLGGARPKASFADPDGSLWIAKFPSQQDRLDVGAWEYVATRLAARAGIVTPQVRIERLGSQYHTFCSRRFDRQEGARRMYGSAMTLVGKQDSEPSSYLEIAEAVERSGDPAAIKEDLAELFRRVIFNVLTANRDDHLRNHGFLRNAAGWRLAPAFDMNPAPEKFEHVLAFDDVARTPDIDVVLETAGLYRLKRGEANAIASHVKQAVTAWHEEARVLRIPSDEIERMARAFDESGP